MKIMCVDDEQLLLDSMLEAVKAVCVGLEIYGFSDAGSAIKFTNNYMCEIAFLDIEMPETDGLDLAKTLKQINPNINIIFVSESERYFAEAFQLHASGYIKKPVTQQDVEYEIRDLRRPVEIKSAEIRVQAFGNFEIYSNGEIIKFSRAKTKEALAYLIDRKGAAIPYAQLRAVLWEDEEDTDTLKSRLRKCISDLKQTLEGVGASRMILKTGHSIAVDVNTFVCDYYDWQKGLPYATNLYCGEYMLQYAWSEYTLGAIERHSQKNGAY